MSDSRVLGKMEAILLMTERNLEKYQRYQRSIGELAIRLNQSTTEIDQLKGIIHKMEQVLNQYKQTDWMTTVQLALELHVHEKTIRNWYENGIIPGHRISEKGHIRFDRFEVTEAIRSRGV